MSQSFFDVILLGNSMAHLLLGYSFLKQKKTVAFLVSQERKPLYKALDPFYSHPFSRRDDVVLKHFLKKIIPDLPLDEKDFWEDLFFNAPSLLFLEENHPLFLSSDLTVLKRELLRQNLHSFAKSTEGIENALLQYYSQTSQFSFKKKYSFLKKITHQYPFSLSLYLNPDKIEEILVNKIREMGGEFFTDTVKNLEYKKEWGIETKKSNISLTAQQLIYNSLLEMRELGVIPKNFSMIWPNSFVFVHSLGEKFVSKKENSFIKAKGKWNGHSFLAAEDQNGGLWLILEHNEIALGKGIEYGDAPFLLLQEISEKVLFQRKNLLEYKNNFFLSPINLGLTYPLKLNLKLNSPKYFFYHQERYKAFLRPIASNHLYTPFLTHKSWEIFFNSDLKRKGLI